MKHSTFLQAIMAMALLALAASAHAQVTYRIEQIGPDPDPPDVNFYFVNDMNDKGEVIGGAYASAGFWAWLWRDGELIRLPTLPNPSDPAYVNAYGINDRTQIVGDSSTADAAGARPFIWQRGQMRDLGSFPGSGVSAVDVNNLDMVIGQLTINGRLQPFVQWGRHTLMLDTLPNSPFTTVGRINELGVICGNSDVAIGQTRAVIWKLGHIQDLGVLPGADDSSCKAINDRDQVAVEVRFGQGESSRPAIWKAGHLVELPLPRYADYLRAGPTGINNAGTLVGNAYYGLTNETLVLLWRNGVVYNLADLIRADDPSRPYVKLQQAQMINNRGQIVVIGSDTRKAGQLPFLLTPSGHL